jgi:hypothetical protein
VPVSKGQESKTRAAEALYTKARRQGWTRERFYYEISNRREFKSLKREIKDNLIDSYRAPKVRGQKRRIPEGYTPRTLQESAIEMENYRRDLDQDGADYVIIEEEGGYRAYVQPTSP